MRSHTDAERSRLIGQTLDALGEADPRVREHGMKHFSDGFDVLGASAIGFDSQRPTEVHLTLKQRDCTWSRFAAVMELADACASWKVTRLDVNFDDQARAAEPADIAAACAEGQAVTRVQLDRVQGVVINQQMQSVYVGSRSSDRYLNVYDKDAERAHALKQPVALGTYGVRWELRLRDERATVLCKRLRTLSDVHELHSVFWQSVVSLIDFRARDRTARRGHHLELLPRLDWFTRLAGEVARQTSYLPRVPDTEDVRLWRVTHWLFRNSAAIAEVQQRHPNPSVLRELVAVGSEKLERRRARVQAKLAVA